MGGLNTNTGVFIQERRGRRVQRMKCDVRSMGQSQRERFKDSVLLALKME